MYFIIILLTLPILIKLFTNLGLRKLSLLPRTVITAEMVIEDMNRRKIRQLKVEMKYNYTQKLFHDNIRNKELSRERILAIRYYLEKSVKQYEHKKFKNDVHAIYTMLKAKDITVRNLEIVQSLISIVDRSVDPYWINIAAIRSK
ncbi:hypothetical protein [Clostridium beijerinckii]|uniref:hypothetical protein n=1 Tax=Clostridium beijerinckii TaxID=1520 RepID=UPI001493DF49|nr:hypothetical protein [Clostridium beijerinckii]NOW07883.1 hypothetical protein [Clostridium beijerinckii]NYC05441.1 hypothetical protein [Clostridium beijerinckii]NYC05514.1 hypothetical protein [Clostridium beijerinckii]